MTAECIDPEPKDPPKRKTVKMSKVGGLSFWGFGHCQGSRGIGETMAEIYDVDIIFDDTPDVTEEQDYNHSRPKRLTRIEKPKRTTEASHRIENDNKG